MSIAKIVWTKIDEAPALATYSLLPIVNAFTKGAGVDVVTSDISLAGRVLAVMGKMDDELAKLGELVLKPEARYYKATKHFSKYSEVKACIAEFQSSKV